MGTSARSARAETGPADGLEQARDYLRRADPVLARIIDERPGFDPRRWLAELPAMDLFGALTFQVVGQQLSVAATRRTIARLEARFGEPGSPSAADVLGADPAVFRGRRPVLAQSRHAARSGRAAVRWAARPGRAGRTGG